MPHPGAFNLCSATCTRFLAGVLLLLTLLAALSPLMDGADVGAYAEVERMVSLQVDHDCDAGDPPEVVCHLRTWQFAAVVIALPSMQETLLPHIGGAFVPEPHPPKLA